MCVGCRKLELVGGQIMRQSESKGEKIGLICERIELITTVIKFRNCEVG